MEFNDDKIVQDFADLFGFNNEPAQEPEPQSEPDTPAEDQSANEPDNAGNEPAGEGQSNEGAEEGTPEEPKKDSQAKQNFAFAQLRTQNKEYNRLIKDLGEAIGLPKDTSIEDITSKVKDLILNKQAKDQNIPVETLREIQELKDLAQEHKQIKLEQEVTAAFTSLASKFQLSSDALVEFANHLEANGKNPLSGVQVDIEAEYLKLHFQDMLQKAAEDAIKSEEQRKQNAQNHGSSGVPSKKGDTGSNDSSIGTVADLDKYFSNLEL